MTVIDDLEIDQDLDQTARHEHFNGKPCPACGRNIAKLRTYSPAADGTALGPDDLLSASNTSGLSRQIPSTRAEVKALLAEREKQAKLKVALGGQMYQDLFAQQEKRITELENLVRILAYNLDKLR